MMNNTTDTDTEPTLSAFAMKLRDRFKEFTGFHRKVVHELGHAVVAIYLELPIISVTIEGSGILAGACTYGIRPEDLGNNQLTADQAVTTAGARVAVVQMLVGHEMTEQEALCSFDSNHDEYRLDEDNLLGLAKYLNISDAEFDLWRRQQFSRASEILEIPYVWKTLKLLAKELKREGTLSGTRIREVLDESRAEEA